MNSVLTSREYNISGNIFRAYYDADNKLVFIIDNTLDDRKPNVLLVINPVGDRKWDDILANDYIVDLETVRPKKDNKYQKLDIEYSGLSVYDNLIRAYDDRDDLSGPLAELSEFRDAASRRAATERLAAAEAKAARSRETIVKANDTIAELRARLRQLRTRMAQQKKQVGREPTKQSASKILKTDAQIDATNERLRRAKKRLDNAQRRLVVADADAEIAREILAAAPVEHSRNTSVIDVLRPNEQSSKDIANLPAAATHGDLIAQQVAPVPAEIPDDYYHDISYRDNDSEYSENYNIQTNIDIPDEQKAEKMAEDEVKPLFDKDPEILDEEIAFKPIEFGVSSPTETSEQSGQQANGNMSSVDMHSADHHTYAGEPMSDVPLSFTPPVSRSASETDQNTNSEYLSDETPVASPVLDTMSAVNAPRQTMDSMQSETMADNLVRPVSPALQNAPTDVPYGQTTGGSPDVAPAPVSSDLRPVSPITGTPAPTNPAPRRPTTIYYVMLVLLIALSIFTLWLYQRNTNDSAPDLATTIPAAEIAPETLATDNSMDTPFIPTMPETAPTQVVSETTQITVPAPVAEPEQTQPVPAPTTTSSDTTTEQTTQTTSSVEPAPTPVISASDAPKAAVPAPVATPVAEPAPTTIDTTPQPSSVAPTTAATAPVAIETEEEILASKPAYNVSQNEKMFVADPQYDTETQYTASETLPTCPDGLPPDMYGCCAGEVYTDLGAAGFNCCPETGGDCFPPLL